MKRISFLILGILLVSCGGGGGGGTGGDGVSGNHPPTISNITYSPASAYQNQGGGSLAVSISFDFSDIGGDVKELHIDRYDSSGNLVRSSVMQITGLQGFTTGLIRGSPAIDTSITGIFTFELYIVDNAGASSNILTGTFTTTPLDKSWSSPTLISIGSGSNYFEQPDVATNISGDYFVVWPQFSGTIWVIKAKKYTQASGWGPIFDISSTTTSAIKPKIAMDSNGNAICIWIQNKYVYASKYTISGGWESPQIVSNTSSDYSTDQSISMNSNGDAIAVWSHLGYPIAGENVWASIYSPSTGWGLPYNVDSGSTDWNTPKVKIDTAGNAFIVWTSKYSLLTQNVYSRRYNKLSGWGVTQLLSSGSNNSFNPRLAIDTSGNAMVVWSEYINESQKSIFAKPYFTSTGWGTTISISSNRINIGYPDIGGGSNGYFIAVWQEHEDNGGNQAIFSNIFSPSTGWQGVNNTSIVAEPYYPRISMNENNDAVVLSEGGSWTGIKAIRYKYSSGWLTDPGTSTWISPANGNYKYPIVAINQNGDALTACSGVNASYGIWVTLLQ